MRGKSKTCIASETAKPPMTAAPRNCPLEGLDENAPQKHIVLKTMPSRTFHLTKRARLLLVAVFMVASGALCFGQGNQPKGPGPPAIDLLTLSGSQPGLTPAGEGIASIKISDLFAIGKTEVKPFDSSFKIELPVGYALFNDLAYMIDSKAVFSGPNDFAFIRRLASFVK